MTRRSPKALLEDSGVRWLAFSRLLTVVGGPVTLWFVLQKLGEDDRGLWVVGLNVVALGPLVEMGVGSLLVQFVAHASGAADQAHLWNLARHWYRSAAIVVAAVAGTLGGYLLTIRATDGLPATLSTTGWMVIVSAVALYIALVPSIAFREGGGHRVGIQRVRAVQAAVNLAILWTGLLAGLGLHTLVPAALGQWLVAGFAMRFLALPKTPPLDPMNTSSVREAASAEFQLEQRRSAILWFLLWLAPQSLTPSLLLRGDFVDAGRLGVTMALALGPTTFALAWLQARFALFGALVARGEVRAFEASARQATAQALGIQLLGSAGLVMLVALLRDAVPILHSGVLPLGLLSMLLLGNTCLLMVQAALAWGRAFRTEALSIPSSIGLFAMLCGIVVAARIGGLLWCVIAFAGGASAALTIAMRALSQRRALLPPEP